MLIFFLIYAQAHIVTAQLNTTQVDIAEALKFFQNMYDLQRKQTTVMRHSNTDLRQSKPLVHHLPDILTVIHELKPSLSHSEEERERPTPPLLLESREDGVTTEKARRIVFDSEEINRRFLNWLRKLFEARKYSNRTNRNESALINDFKHRRLLSWFKDLFRSQTTITTTSTTTPTKPRKRGSYGWFKTSFDQENLRTTETFESTTVNSKVDKEHSRPLLRLDSYFEDILIKLNDVLQKINEKLGSFNENIQRTLVLIKPSAQSSDDNKNNNANDMKRRYKRDVNDETYNEEKNTLIPVLHTFEHDKNYNINKENNVKTDFTNHESNDTKIDTDKHTVRHVEDQKTTSVENFENNSKKREQSHFSYDNTNVLTKPDTFDDKNKKTDKSDEYLTNNKATIKPDSVISGRRFNSEYGDVDVIRNKLISHIENDFNELKEKLSALVKVKEFYKNYNPFKVGYITANLDTLENNLSKMKVDMDNNKFIWTDKQTMEMFETVLSANTVVGRLMESLKQFTETTMGRNTVQPGSSGNNLYFNAQYEQF